MKKESIGTILFRLIRGLMFLLLSIFGSLVGILGFLQQEWTMGIFGLLVMIIADRNFDELYEKIRKKKENEEEWDNQIPKELYEI